MIARKKRKQSAYLKQLRLHIHEQLYPRLTTKRQEKIEEVLKRERNVAVKWWRGLENIFLDMPTQEELKRGFVDYSLTASELRR